MRRRWPVSVALVVVAAGACQTREEGRQIEATGSRGQQASPATTQNAAEEEAIRQREREWREALAAKDTTTLAQLYTDDGLYLPQGSDGYEGPEEVGARWAGEFTDSGLTLEREPKRIEIAGSGDLAYEAGRYKVSWGKSDFGPPGSAAGNYVTVWKKVDGQWKTAAYIWNRGEGEDD